ncbi:glycosyltransferase family 2 protein [Limimaricola cinnabarinus]|uniref:glycosyltransferase family 2 protein n=1 Tax=Limimaricola cinnabarinus TaxID=1125964 RepID=UPI0024915CB5|nr:glycosyltransferase family A protein [Limimaricola cinnabarinus]
MQDEPDPKMALIDYEAAQRLVKKSGHLHGNWYRKTYRDVDLTGLSPSEHFLRYGAALGRNPGKNFHTRRYLEAYPEVAESGMNPLLHYVLEGQDKGYSPYPRSTDPVQRANREVSALRTHLLTLGFTKPPLKALDAMTGSDAEPAICAAAARELALWNMRKKTDTGYRAALERIAQARPGAHDLDFRRKLTTIELLCHKALGQRDEGLACYERGALAGEIGPDAILARVNFETEPEARCFWINHVLRRYRIPTLKLMNGADRPPYDRLTINESPICIDDGPKVTVLLAAYDAADMIGTALRSLQAQSWQNLEIIVIDDCSPDNGATCAEVERFAAADSRIKLLRMERNGGAYVARNHGLDLATGEFVTIHDADDWSHPVKIETQVRYLQGHPAVMGCTSEQARTMSDLNFRRWTGQGRLLFQNTSSFMFRREPVRAELGYWDTVRFAADSEFIRRIVRVFGKQAVAKLETGPLSFQRDSETSVVADDIKGMNGFYYGVRKEYFDAQMHYHASGGSLKYENDIENRPFPVPAMMQPHKATFGEEHHQFDAIFVGDFRMMTEEVAKAVERIEQMKAEGKRVGLVERHVYDADHGSARMAPEVREIIDGEHVIALVFGDEVTGAQVINIAGTELEQSQRYFPSIG